MPMPVSAGAEGATAGHSEQARRREFAAFLRSRRERISPEEVGIRATDRRRTPGLRREEVAELAAVGGTWYTGLGQGRPVRASAQVLQAIADALLLDPNERAYLFTLAEVAQPSGQEQDRDIPAFLPVLLRHVHPDPARPQRGLEWEERAPRLVSMFRTVMARHVSDPDWQRLLDRLRRASPLFDQLWEQHEVGVYGDLPKHFRHPVVGELSLIRFHLWAEPREDGLLAVGYTPADAATEVKLRRLLPLATAEAVS